MTQFVDDDNNYLDYVGDDFGFTKQAAIFTTFSIKGDVSLTFTIPNNSINRETLEYAGLNQKTNSALTKKRFSLIRNGNLISRGFIIITNDDGNEFECFFIAGNSNWLRKFDFKCNEIRNGRFTVQWSTNQINNRRTATEGIIFPVIDFFSRRQKYDKYFLAQRWGGSSVEDVTERSLVTEFYPCLYVHTLVNELSKRADVKLSGTVLSEKLYKKLIITPSGPDLIDPETQTKITNFPLGASTGGNVTIGSIAPEFKAIEMIKWLIFSFGSIGYFDDYNQTLSINLIDKFKKEDAEDWSEYFLSYEIKYNEVSQHNYVRTEESPEQEIQDYNKGKELAWGELDIESGKDDGSDNDVYESPFLIPMDDIGTTPMQWATPYVEFVKLEDEKTVAFTSVSSLAGKARFNVASGLELETTDFFPARIECNSGIYTGMHLPNPLGAATDVRYDSYADFVSSTTGNIIMQKVTKVNAGHRILVCIPDLSVKQSTMFTSLDYRAIGSITSAAYAYAFKPRYPYSTLLANKQGLSYGEVEESNYNDVTISEAYLNKIKKMITNPPVYAMMRLPESVFHKFKFDKFIFIQSEQLTGYFIVERIREYKNSYTPVEVKLLYAD